MRDDVIFQRPPPTQRPPSLFAGWTLPLNIFDDVDYEPWHATALKLDLLHIIVFALNGLSLLSRCINDLIDVFQDP